MTSEAYVEKDVHRVISSIQKHESSSPHEHVLTPDTPTGGFGLYGTGTPQNHLKHTSTACENDMSQDNGFNLNMRCWTEILNAMDKVKMNARLWQSQTERLETKIGILDAVTLSVLSAKTSVEEKLQDLSTELATLRLDKEAQEGECHGLRETVASLKRDLASEEQARRRLEHVYESKEMEWTASNAHVQMELDLTKGLLVMQKEAELQHRDTNERAVKSLRCIIEKKDEEIQNFLSSVDSLKSTAASVKHDMEVVRLEADKYKVELDDVRRKHAEMVEQYEKDQKRHEEDMKRSQEVFQSHKDAHHACLGMKDIEISSLKDLGQSVQRECGAKICLLEAQITALEDSLLQWKEKYESIRKRYEEQCVALTEFKSQNSSLKAQVDTVTDTVKALQGAESAYSAKLKELDTTIREERVEREAMEKKMHQELDQEIIQKKNLQSNNTLLESKLMEISQKYESLQKSYEGLQEKYQLLMKKAPTHQNDASILAVRPAAKRALQKRMKVSQKKTSDALA